MITLTNQNDQSCFLMESFTPIMATILERVRPQFQYNCGKGKLESKGTEASKLDCRNLMIFLEATNLKSKEDAIQREYTKMNKEGDGEKIKYKFNNQRAQEMQLLDIITGTFSLMIMHLYNHMAPFGNDAAGMKAKLETQELIGTNNDVLSYPMYELESKINDVVSSIHNAFIHLMDHKYNTGMSKMILQKEVDTRDLENEYEFKKTTDTSGKYETKSKHRKSKKSNKSEDY